MACWESHLSKADFDVWYVICLRFVCFLRTGICEAWEEMI